MLDGSCASSSSASWRRWQSPPSTRATESLAPARQCPWSRLTPARPPNRSSLGQGKSLFVDLPRDARDVLVSDPRVVDAVIRTPRRIYLTAIPPDATMQSGSGQANVIVFDRAGAPIVNLEVSIEQGDTNDIEKVLARLIPGSDITVEWAPPGAHGNIVLSGTVKSALDARKAQDIANAFLGILPPPGAAGSGTAIVGGRRRRAAAAVRSAAART